MAVTKEILALAVEIGDALLRNGAEVYRVEDTVMHILEAYEIENYDVYVLSNGIFASANEDREDACSMIRHSARHHASRAHRCIKPAFPRDLFPRMFADRRLEPSGKM